MPVIGITGGIATGKTTFVRALLKSHPAPVFDADACARELLESDALVRDSIRAEFGSSVITAAGAVDRVQLREIVFKDDTRRRALEAILHPVIRARWTTQAEETSGNGGWLFVDIPLLFETNAEAHFSRVVVVACSPEVQRTRLHQDRGLDTELAGRIIASQLDLRLKMAKADHLIWNDSTPANLEEQAMLFAGWLRNCHG